MAITGDGEARTWVMCKGKAQHALWYSAVASRNADSLDPRVFGSFAPGDPVVPDEPTLSSTSCPVCGAALFKAGELIPGSANSSVRWALGLLGA